MKLKYFKEQNMLPEGSKKGKKTPGAFRDIYKPQVPVIMCYGLSFWERLVLLFTGKLWVSYLTYGRTLLSSRFTVSKSDVILPAAKDDVEPIKVSGTVAGNKDVPAARPAMKKVSVNDPTL